MAFMVVTILGAQALWAVLSRATSTLCTAASFLRTPQARTRTVDDIREGEESETTAQLIEPQFHAGELAAQQRAGVAPRRSAIRDAMPDQHRLFFLWLPFVLVATHRRQTRNGFASPSSVSRPQRFVLI
jgi:hypothetical protein